MTTAGNTADATGQGSVQVKFVTKIGHEQLDRHRLRILPARRAEREHLVPQPRPAAGSGDRQGAEGQAETTTSRASRRADRSCRNKAFFFFNYEEQRSPSVEHAPARHPVARSRRPASSATTSPEPTRAGEPAAARGRERPARDARIRSIAKLLADIQAVDARRAAASSPLIEPAGAAVHLVDADAELQSRRRRSASTTRLTQKHRLTGSMNYRHINSTPGHDQQRAAAVPGFCDDRRASSRRGGRRRSRCGRRSATIS